MEVRYVCMFFLWVNKTYMCGGGERRREREGEREMGECVFFTVHRRRIRTHRSRGVAPCPAEEAGRERERERENERGSRRGEKKGDRGGTADANQRGKEKSEEQQPTSGRCLPRDGLIITGSFFGEIRKKQGQRPTGMHRGLLQRRRELRMMAQSCVRQAATQAHHRTDSL